MNELVEAEKKLLEVAHMSAGDLPKSYQENHANIWRAFYAGVEWHKFKSAQHRVHLTAFGASTRALRAKFRAFIQPLLARIGGK